MRKHTFKAGTQVNSIESGVKFKIADRVESTIIVELGHNYYISVGIEVETFGKNKGREYFVFGFERVYAPLELTHMEITKFLIEQMQGYQEMLEEGIITMDDFKRLTTYDEISELIRLHTTLY